MRDVLTTRNPSDEHGVTGTLTPSELNDQRRFGAGATGVGWELFRRFWEHKLDALDTEIARGKRERRRAKKGCSPG